MDSTIAEAGAKLALTEKSITVLKNKHALAALQGEMEALQRGAGEYVKPQSAWMPLWLKRIRAKGQIPRQIPTPPSAVIYAKMEAARKRMEELRGSNVLEFTMTPLTVGDDYEISAHVYKIRKQVLASFVEPETSQEGVQAREEAVDAVTNLIQLAKMTECILKKKGPDGQWMRAMSYEEVRKLHPFTLKEICNTYAEAFELTDDEIKK